MTAGLNQVSTIRERVIRDLFPDTCTLTPMSGGSVVISGGVMTSATPTPRTWRNKTDVPCRMDIDRAFRPDKFKNQVTVVDEYTLELPFDATVEASDTVTYQGRKFAIRKIKQGSKWDVTIECIVTEIETEIDNR